MAHKCENLQWYDDGVMDGLQMASEIVARHRDVQTIKQKLAEFVMYLKLELEKNSK